eukprot:3712889-Prymnesium_polylepis.2
MHAQLHAPPMLSFEELILKASQSDETVRGAVYLHAQVCEFRWSPHVCTPRRWLDPLSWPLHPTSPHC